MITDPVLKVVDIPALLDIAKRHSLPLVMDSIFAPPPVMKPLELGIDLVVHSASKYLNGHSNLIAGAVCGPRKMVNMIWPRLLNYSDSLDLHACFLPERGLKTLNIHMKAHEASAIALAKLLETHPVVENALYPMLSSHPNQARAKKLMKMGAEIGIHPGCVRLVVGIEDAEDLISDFDQALNAISNMKGAA